MPENVKLLEKNCKKLGNDESLAYFILKIK